MAVDARLREELIEEIRNDPSSMFHGVPVSIVVRMLNEYQQYGLRLDATLLEQAKANPFNRTDTRVVEALNIARNFLRLNRFDSVLVQIDKALKGEYSANTDPSLEAEPEEERPRLFLSSADGSTFNLTTCQSCGAAVVATKQAKQDHEEFHERVDPPQRVYSDIKIDTIYKV